MKIFFLRLFFIIALIFFEFSFLDILFPWTIGPILVFVSVIIWSLSVPFPNVFWRVIPTTLFLDIISSGMPGFFSLYAVCLVYATSFISRRLSIEQSTVGMTISLLLTLATLFGLRIFSFLFSGRTEYTLDSFFPFLFSSDVFFSLLLCIPIFLIASFFIVRFERYIQYVAQGEFSRIR